MPVIGAMRAAPREAAATWAASASSPGPHTTTGVTFKARRPRAASPHNDAG